MEIFSLLALLIIFLVLSIFFTKVPQNEIKDEPWVNGVQPCPPIGKMHEWVYNNDRQDFVCSKCNKTPSELN